MLDFKVLKKDKNNNARLGLLKTSHGLVKTPSYVIVATHGEIKTLKPSDIKRTKTQIVISNTYHLWNEVPKTKNYELNTKNLGSFVLSKLKTKLPTMTDSGGFQVLSLAFSNKNKIGKFMTGSRKNGAVLKRDKIKITPKGVYFKQEYGPPSLPTSPRGYEGHRKLRRVKQFLGPELSMKIQSKIGADMVFAFDQITSPLDSYSYNKKAVAMTDRWAKVCLKTKDPQQALFGIVQGGLFKDLRIKSAKSIGSMPFDGFGIGGSYTKKQIAKVLKWIIPHLPEEKPRHLLGVGKIEDIFEAIENGIDTFDCVIPTREARHGRIWSSSGYYDIRKSLYAKDKKRLGKRCKCPTCKTTTRAKLHKLFKGKPGSRSSGSSFATQKTSPELLLPGKRLATIHNVYFFNDLVEKIRKSIENDDYKEFKKKFIANLNSPEI